ncbi:MAG: single-stranded-DNA-specific exonuclease RecJ [Nitrospirota bacterium]|nr:MAG: single-stranded-DNA-specific exonuclease RecJ [Nitrospirota bacterium]
MASNWYVRRTNPEFVRYLAGASSISTTTAQVLINRGFKTPEEISDFFDAAANKLSDPSLLPDVHKAAERIKEAAINGEKVLVHGDYDADGVTATAILLITLRSLDIKCDYFIPNRFRHGYGFNTEAIRVAKEKGFGLIITVDCGITSFNEAEEARSAGVDLIITDHHEPQRDIDGMPKRPVALAVVNPKLRPDVELPLCGAGIALKLAYLLLGSDMSSALFDLAAIGTVADMVPLHGDNRIIARLGLELINNDSRFAIEALKDVSSLEGRKISAGLLGYSLIPRINATGRISDASEAVEMLVSDNMDRVQTIASELNSNNYKRQKIEEGVLREALSMLKGRPVESCIVLHNDDWHEGVIGIVASRLTDMFKRPSFVLSVKDGVATGSARSVSSLDICECLSGTEDILIRYGGHKQAAGLSLSTDMISDFRERMISIVRERLGDEEPSDDLYIDAEVSLKDITFPLMKELSKLEPFGTGNEEPVLAARDLEVVSPRVVRKNHLKMKLRFDSYTLDAIWFNKGDVLQRLIEPGKFDAAFIPSINEWGGGKSLQLTVKDIRPSVVKEENL